VTIIKISVLTTGQLARKTGPAAQSDTDNAMLIFRSRYSCRARVATPAQRRDGMRQRSTCGDARSAHYNVLVAPEQ